MDEMIPSKNTQNRKLSFHWTDRKKNLIHYRMLEFYVRHAMIVDKVHEIISFKQSKWLKSFINLNLKKGIKL